MNSIFDAKPNVKFSSEMVMKFEDKRVIVF